MSTIELTPETDVRRAATRDATKIDWLDSKHSFSFGQPLRPGQHPPRSAAGQQRRRRRARHRLRDAPAPRHGDRHLGAAGVARAPGLHRAQRRDLPGPRAADERRHRHPALGEERRLAPRAASTPSTRTRCTSCRCGSCPTRRGITPGYEQLEIDDELLQRRPGARRLRHGPRTTARPRSGSRTSTPRCYAARLAARPDASSCPRRPYLHLFVPRGAVDARGRRRPGRRATPSGSPRPAASG